MTGSMVSIIFLTGALSLFVFIIVFLITSIAAKDKIASDKRLTELQKKQGEVEEIGLVHHETKAEKKRRERKKSDSFEKMAEALYKQLLSADIKMRPEEFLIIWILAATLPAAIVAMILENYVIAIALMIAGGFIPVFVIKSKKKSRSKKFDDQLGDALIIACSSLRSGLSFTQAMEAIAKDMPDPIGAEFRLVIAEMSMGTSMDDALERLNQRIKSQYLSLMVSAVLIQRQTGGNLSQILENISDSIKEKAKLKQELKSATASGKMTGLMVGSMPFALMGLFSVMNWDFMAPLFQTSMGHKFIIAACVLELICFFVVKKIINVKM